MVVVVWHLEVFSDELSFCLCCSEESEEASPGAAKEKVCLKRKRKRLQMANARIKRRAMLNRRAVLESTDQWEQVLTYKVLQTKAGPRTKTKKLVRVC